jgi:predicted Zn-dependent protease
MDPELGFPPFWTMLDGESPIAMMYFPVTLIKDGVLVTLPYSKEYAGAQLGQMTGRLSSGAFRMSGGPTTIEEMIATTKRGLVVTRFDNVELLDSKSALVRGYTRDGTWFIENGKITKPVTNLAATESVLFLLNNIEQLGVPQRIFNAPLTWQQGLAPVLPQPAVVPPLKIRDFSFTALIDAV